jgi:hypothetical protein
MDDNLTFSSEEQPLPITTFDSASSHPSFAFNHNTWPLYGNVQMSHSASNSPPSRHGELDNRSNLTSPLPLSSPAFGMNPSNQDQTLSLPTSTAITLSPAMASSMAHLQLAGYGDIQGTSAGLSMSTSATAGQPLQSDLTLHQALNISASSAMMPNFNAFALAGLNTSQSLTANAMAYTGTYDLPLHTSPTDEFLPTSQAQMQPNLVDSFLVPSSMGPVSNMDPMGIQAPVMHDLNHIMSQNWQTSLMQDVNTSPYMNPSIGSSSPDANDLISRSYSNQSDNSWTLIDHPARQSMEFSDSSISPQILHVRSDSDSSHNSSPGATYGSSDEMFPISPEPDHHADHHMAEYPFQTQRRGPTLPAPMAIPVAQTSKAIAPRSRDSSSSAQSSPKSGRRRTSPTGKAKKKGSGNSAKERADKKVGKRKGPLKPEQRQSAHEIRKLRACMRCKFLKKVCDKGDPCTGCQPSHARLWQVPCTRIDIKDLAYFLKDWNADYERHVTLGFSIANIKGFDNKEIPLFVTHGYGFMMPIWARRVYVRDEAVFEVDWREGGWRDIPGEEAKEFEVSTAHLSTGHEGISKKVVSEYVDLHLDKGFDHFVAEYFEGTPFVSEALKSINQYYLLTRQSNIRKGLKLVIAYCLTCHITMLTGLSDEEADIGKIDDPASKWYGSTCAPVMINFEVKKAMAELWRDLMREVLEELSALYSSVYNGEKLKNWPTIFMLAVLILAVWEMMQFDCHYRIPDEGAVNKFCGDMEHVPVGVIIGLFGAISTKLPTFLEWDADKHGAVWNGDEATCKTMTSFRSHVEKHGKFFFNS